MEKHLGNHPIGKPKGRWENKMKIYLKGIGSEVDGTGTASCAAAASALAG
jgi:hypothetical protein